MWLTRSGGSDTIRPMLSPDQAAFLDAAERGDVDVVRRLLAAGVDINSRDPRSLPRQRTALMHAAGCGHLGVVATLLSAGADTDCRDRGLGAALPGGNTALLLALRSKHVPVARALLDAGSSPNIHSAGTSVLALAAGLGDTALVRQLLKLGLDPNFRPGKRAEPPLSSALFGGHTDIARLLLTAGANPNTRMVLERDGFTYMTASVIFAASASVNGVASCATAATASAIIATTTHTNGTDSRLCRFTSEVFFDSRMSAQPLRVDRSRLFHSNDLVGGFNLCA